MRLQPSSEILSNLRRFHCETVSLRDLAAADSGAEAGGNPIKQSTSFKDVFQNPILVTQIAH